VAKKQLISSDEILTPYTRCVTQRTKMLARIKRLKANPNYDREAVRALLTITRRLSSARARMLDNYFRAYYAEHKIPEAQQDHFSARERGRRK
jgi:hypothetical protein